MHTENVNVEQVDEIKFLEVMVNENSCWKSHISYFHTKVEDGGFWLFKANVYSTETSHQKCS